MKSTFSHCVNHRRISRLVLAPVWLWALGTCVLAGQLDQWEVLRVPSWQVADNVFECSRLNGVAGGNGIYVAVGGNATILTSENGHNWTSRHSRALYHLYSVAFGANTFVAVGFPPEVGAEDTALTSPDGVTWTSQHSGTTNGLYGVAYAHGIFVTVGADTILTSSDGIQWARQPPPRTWISGA